MAGEFNWQLDDLRTLMSHGDLRIFMSENWEIFGPTMNALQYLLTWTPFALDGTSRSYRVNEFPDQKQIALRTTPISLFESAALSVKKYHLPPAKWISKERSMETHRERFFNLIGTRDGVLFSRVMTVTNLARVREDFYSNIICQPARDILPDRYRRFLMVAPPIMPKNQPPNEQGGFFD